MTPNVSKPGSLLSWSLNDHLAHVWRGRYILGSTVLLGVVGGLVYALLTPAVYKSNTVIQPRATNQVAILGLGGLGGEGGSQLSKLEVILKSRDLAMDVHKRNPDLAREINHKIWDPYTRRWKTKNKRKPADAFLAGSIAGTLEVKSNIRKNLLDISAETEDPKLSKRVLDAYLAALNVKMRESVRQDADSNQASLYRELERTTDPQLRERILALIGTELERSMLVNARAFDIIDRPVLLTKKTGPSRRKALVLSFALGLFAGLLLLYVKPAYRELRGRLKEFEPA